KQEEHGNERDTEPPASPREWLQLFSAPVTTPARRQLGSFHTRVRIHHPCRSTTDALAWRKMGGLRGEDRRGGNCCVRLPGWLGNKRRPSLHQQLKCAAQVTRSRTRTREMAHANDGEPTRRDDVGLLAARAAERECVARQIRPRTAAVH